MKYLAWVVLSVSLLQPAWAGEVPLRDFFRNPEKVSFQLSDDGQTIAYMAPYEHRFNIFIQPRGATTARRITGETDRSIEEYCWKGSDRLLFLKDFGGDENAHLFCVDKAGQQQRDLTPFKGVKVFLIDILDDSPDEVLISMNQRKAEVFDVYRLNLTTGALKLVAENPGSVVGWLTDHAGQVRVALRSDGVKMSLLYRETESDVFQTTMTTDFRQWPEPVLFTFDNHDLIALSSIGRDKLAVVKIDPRTGKELAVIATNPDVDMCGVSYSRKRKVLTAVSYTTAKEQQQFMDDATAARYQRMKRQLPDYEITPFSNRRLNSHDRNETAFIIHAFSDRSRGADYLYDVSTDKLTKLADRAPWLNERDMAAIEPITYTSRDGLTINGYLTVPNNRPAKNLPVVINPHGGPCGVRDDWFFNPEVQFLANRGYAVLQMEYRGSGGYGRKFVEASFKQWGRKMQDDISDGVAWLIQRGIADPKRIAIYGASYGGYATLAGVTFTPDLYACGVDLCGVANMFTFRKTEPAYWKPYQAMMDEMIGDPVKDQALLEQISPVFHVDQIKVPLLIAQGANDPRVNKAESDQMVAALRKRGIPVEYLVKDNEGHGNFNEENRLDFYGAMEKFLAQHLKNQP